MEWLLALFAELRDWDEQRAAGWSDNLKPMAEMLAERLAPYFEMLPRPIRQSVHPNSAFSLVRMVENCLELGDRELEKRATTSAQRFFGQDRSCSLAFEPSGSDFLSPCLAEADLKRRLLPKVE